MNSNEAYGEPNDTTQHAPRPEPVTAPLPSEAVEALRQIIIDARDQHSYPVDGDDGWEERCRCGLWPPAGVALSADGAALWLWQHQDTEVARAVLAAGYTLPAADQRARDEGTVRESLRDLAQSWIDEDDVTQWGDHTRNHCGRAVLEILDGSR
jgi:hypothetical protein